jgi:hypothetical protein
MYGLAAIIAGITERMCGYRAVMWFHRARTLFGCLATGRRDMADTFGWLDIGDSGNQRPCGAVLSAPLQRLPISRIRRPHLSST